MIAKRLLATHKASYGSGGGGIVIPSTDVYYDYRSLILNMQGSAGSTTFTDSSPNNFTVTPYGNAQLASDATFGTVASFDGSEDYLDTPSTINNSLGTSDFTIELWMYRNSALQQYPILVSNGAWASNKWAFHDSHYQYPNKISFWAYNNGQNIVLSGSTQLSNNTWYHIALVRQSGVFKIYVNGSLDGSVTNGFNLDSNTAQPYLIGYSGATNTSFNGKIGPLRISPWAVYKSNFTPSTDLFPAAPDSIYANPYYDKVALQLKFDGTNGSTNFVDTGPNAFAVTPSGNAQITSASKYGSGAGAFDGSGDYLDTPNTTALDLPSDFTVEAWIYGIGLSTTSSCIVGKWQNPVAWALLVATDKIQFGTGNSGAFSATYTFSTSISNGTWNHIAVSRSGTSLKCFLNGVQVGTTQTVSVNLTATSTTDIGRLKSTNSNYLNGSIDELEITPGVAKYKANFTPPVRGLSTIYNPYTTLPVSGAALWLDGADSSTLFTDAGVTPVAKSGDLVYQWSDKSGNNRHATQTTSGNRPTWVPPASGRNGLGAVSFNGSQWIDCSNSTNYNFGSSDFTIEGWFNLSTTSQPSTFIAKDLQGNRSWIFFYQSSNSTINFVMFGTSTKSLTNAYSAVANTWFHATVVRSGNTVLMFINGVLQPNTLDVTGYSPAANTSAIRLGMHYSSTNGYNMKGQIQNAIIWPQALYTSNFTPWMS